MRAALGAGRWRIGRQLLIEAGLISAAGGVFGCVLAYWSVNAFVALIPADLPRADEIAVDTGALSFAVLSSLFVGLLFGLAPAWSSCRHQPTVALSRRAATASESTAGRRLRGALVVSQIALAMVLMSGAGLLMNSFLVLNRSDPGFDPHDVLTFSIDWPAEKYPRPADAFRELRIRLLAIPGVLAASTGLQLPDRGIPMIDDVSPLVVEVEGLPVPAGERERTSILSTQPGYFGAMGIPLVRGRDFADQDMADARRVAIVNESMARTYFPDGDPIGKHFALSSWTLPGESAAEIVGVAGDVKHSGLGVAAQPLVYLPLGQQPRGGAQMVLKTGGDPLRYADAVREAVLSFDPDQPVYDLQTLEQRVSESLAGERLRALFLTLFSTIAVALAGIGLYGVLSYVIAQRTLEVGIRMALGANPRDARMLVFRQGMLWAGAGIVIGFVCAAWLTRLIESFLFGITPTDPLTFLVVTMVLMLVAIAACWIPARYATRIDPAFAVRLD